jgi:pilus assembly protein CpaB
MKIAFNSSWVILGVALLIGGIAAYGVNRYIKHQVDDLEARNKGRKVRVVVPKEDLPKGTVLTRQQVAVREIPSEFAHSNAITPEQFDRVESQKLAYPAVHGEMLLWSLLEGQRTPSFSSRLAPGHRAITVPVDEVNSISGMLEPGDRIDLVVSVKKDSRTFMFPLLQNVTVMATGQRAVIATDADGKDTKHTYTNITLDASPLEAQRVLAAREAGKISALLRPPGDVQVGATTRVDAMTLLGLGGADTPLDKPGVPVLYGHGGPSAGAKPMAGLGGASIQPSPLQQFAPEPSTAR